MLLSRGIIACPDRHYRARVFEKEAMLQCNFMGTVADKYHATLQLRGLQRRWAIALT
jgi:hypothetical protein